MYAQPRPCRGGRATSRERGGIGIAAGGKGEPPPPPPYTISDDDLVLSSAQLMSRGTSAFSLRITASIVASAAGLGRRAAE